ncbi:MULTISPECIES: SDR family NAD(P)-dependent oxidoreductase [Mycobacterium]|uniref:Short chain dehydrogenase/reductase n=1 Tax=Mycobacterium kiyosense TaxID=2871094 RepID=A0A9P3UZ96_9MYCO|nr:MULTISPECIES: SDR family oxidoreductase [Mycobacterium]BDB40316.1 putative short chain dehydrogenase/reductase [Mycobacterium kiyosense]BDE12137.1 putative short chain dehydrogenase/reductase [Mycobacterium sp. 20KCMC460]GLB83838.1 putative short chain dehydrogenase/reductase [Mycobacterium kiyosense]GLB88708.1 putative short chain dehydrogenase/reductase [Mycobacterium kiyosense]GLB95022.1 putative short chain dehydrogenase/reductase [Mycobacterium kiyosense]
MALPTPTPSSTAVVTGASSGIGADIARELAGRGHGVTLVARREDKLRALAEELAARGGNVEVAACDIADPHARAGLFDEIGGRGLTVDILVNNAGIGTIGAVAKTDVDKETAQVRLNVEALVDLTTRAVQQMVPRGRGAILNVGSTAGFHPFPGQVCYSATKAFVHTYTEGLRGELAGTGVTVALLCPGPVRTEFLVRAGMDERTFADAFPKFMWMPSRDVARTGVDALDGDRGTVIPGLPSRLSTRLFQFMPRRLLLPLLNSQHPGLKRDRSA